MTKYSSKSVNKRRLIDKKYELTALSLKKQHKLFLDYLCTAIFQTHVNQNFVNSRVSHLQKKNVFACNLMKQKTQNTSLIDQKLSNDL